MSAVGKWVGVGRLVGAGVVLGWAFLIALGFAGSIEDAEDRARLPELVTEPAAPVDELTAASGWPSGKIIGDGLGRWVGRLQTGFRCTTRLDGRTLGS